MQEFLQKNFLQNQTYIEDGDKKTFSSYKNEVIERNIIINYASYNNIFELIYNSIVSRIYTDTLDEKECYVIESTANSNFLYGEDVINVKVYIEKDTGLCLKMVEVYDKNNEIKEYETLREYKFDSITDEDMKEPDISEYTIIQQSSKSGQMFMSIHFYLYFISIVFLL